MLLVLDKSGSMSDENRMNIMKDAAKFVLDGLTHTDYVGIIAFRHACVRVLNPQP